MFDTGFNQFWIYSTVKYIYFNSKNYDILKHRLPKRDSYIHQWNSGRKDRDGILFYKMKDRIPPFKETYIRLFAYYYLQNKDYHVSEIYDDKFELFNKNEYEIRNLKTVVGGDFLRFVNYATKIKIKKLFISESGLPFVFKMFDQNKISIHSLIVFNDIFKIYDKLTLDKLNIVEKEKLKRYELIFDKYKPLVYDFINDVDWKTYLKRLTNV